MKGNMGWVPQKVTKFNFCQIGIDTKLGSGSPNPSRILGGASRPPPKSFFFITFDRVWISKWNFAGVYQIWIDIFTKNFVIIGDVIDPWWRHRPLKMPTKGPPLTFFLVNIFCSNFVCRLPIRYNFGAWGQFFATCHVRVFYRPAPNYPFCPN